MKERSWNTYLEKMLKSGIFFGHSIKKRHASMSFYIALQKKDINIINITLTSFFLYKACTLVFHAANKKKEFLIVGTNKKTSNLVKVAARKITAHYFNTKWINGTLTNWSITKRRLKNFRNLIIENKKEKIFNKKLVFLKNSLNGIKYMQKLPDVIIIIDQISDSKVIQECNIVNIPTICLVDTNCDFNLSDFSIPLNDDAILSINFCLKKLISAILYGRSG